MNAVKFTVNVILTLVVAATIGLMFRTSAPASWGTTQIIGASLVAVGFLLWTVARFQLGSSIAVSAQANKLVTRGLYSKIRNPIYVFSSCLIAGAILTFGRPVWLLVFLGIISLQVWRAGKESSVLEDAFGEEYRMYRTATWF